MYIEVPEGAIMLKHEGDKYFAYNHHFEKWIEMQKFSFYQSFLAGILSKLEISAGSVVYHFSRIYLPNTTT